MADIPTPVEVPEVAKDVMTTLYTTSLESPSHLSPSDPE